MALRAGFIGLGSIGKPMARRLVAAGLESFVLGALPAPVDELVREGARPARAPRDLAGRADAIGVCVREVGVALPGTGLASQPMASVYGVKDAAGG